MPKVEPKPKPEAKAEPKAKVEPKESKAKSQKENTVIYAFRDIEYMYS